MSKKSEYIERRSLHEDASEIYTYEHYYRFSWYPQRNCTTEDLKNLRDDFKQLRKTNNAFKLGGCNDRAFVYNIGGTYILRSYETDVAQICNGVFKKLWFGYSRTTLKHINIFRGYFYLEPISKKDWIMLD